MVIRFLFKENKKAHKNLELQLNKEINHQKKEYNIDEQLENKILIGINQLESSEEFLNPDFNISLLSKKLNTNTSYVSYIINKRYNQSFKQYVTKLRIEYLIKKLNTDAKFKRYTIKSLAEEIGYTNASAFTRAFKKYKGITPSDYIKTLEDN